MPTDLTSGERGSSASADDSVEDTGAENVSIETEIKKLKEMNDIIYRETYANNKERFAAMHEAKKRGELKLLRWEYDRLQKEYESKGRASERGSVAQETGIRASTMNRQTFVVRETFAMTARGVRYSMAAIGNQIAKTAEAVTPKPAADIISQAREGFIRVNKISGPQGEVPIPKGFAQSARYWELLFWSCLLGGVVGICGSGLLNLALTVRLWYPCDWETDVECGLRYNGYLYFIPLIFGAGLFIGFLRYSWGYRMDTPILFYELRTYKGDFKTGLQTFVLTGVSMAMGGALGPEMGLCALGIGMGTALNEYLDLDNEDDGKLLILSGAVGAFASLLFTPLLAPLLVIEIAIPPKDYMEHVTILSGAAVTSWAVTYPILQHSFLGSPDNGAVLALDWVFHEHQMLYGVIIGMLSAAIGLLSMALRNFCKQVFVRLRMNLGWNKVLQDLIPSSLAGIVLGITFYCLPLTIGYGNEQQKYLIKFASTNAVPMSTLVLSMFFRLLNLGICGTSGWRGGIFLSLVSCGIGMGCIAYRLLDEKVPLGLCVGCFMAGVPSALTAMPFMWTILTCLIFAFDFNQSVPIFVAAITSYLIASGTGLLNAVSETQVPFFPMPKPKAPTPIAEDTSNDDAISLKEMNNNGNDNNNDRSMSAISEGTLESGNSMSMSKRSSISTSTSNPMVANQMF